MSENAIENDIMSWTQEELEIWLRKGFGPPRTSRTPEMEELSDFLRKNKEMLYNLYPRGLQEDHFQIKIPSPNEWESAP
ncbi:MAG: hypothetical protein WAM28_01510 [Chlamydiales bacterium]